jgi:cation-transporting ATPase E
VLVLRPGDQIVVDGEVMGDGRFEADESLLTGESDRVPKKAGDPVFSGSYCMSGTGMYTAGKVGAASMANQIAVGARAFRQVKTPLQRDIDFVVRLLVIMVTQLGILLTISFFMNPIPFVQRMQVAAVIAGLVPQGLFAMTTVTYAMGALRMSGKGALIQQTNAVESLSNVDVLCLDKTGTLTTNNLKFEAAYPLGISEAELAGRLGDFIASMSAGNRTADALSAAFPGQKHATIQEEVIFSSALKWSAVSFDDNKLRGVYVLGAPEVMQPSLQANSDLGPQADQWAGQGLRVLLFAYRPEVTPLHDESDNAQLPDNLIPLGVLSLSDELRPEAEATLRGFAEAGVAVKIISGDSPQTVAALARQAGMSPDLRVVSGLDLAAMSEEEFAETAEEATIFGRITPQQKEQLVRALRNKRHYVAMIGDGVNDVLSLKQAQLGIAMQSGSQATRGAADIVLLNDSFAVLPAAVVEGRRIIGGMQSIMRLMLTHTFYVALIIIAAAMMDVAFPTTPKLRSVVTTLTVGIPILMLAAWAKPIAPPRSILRSILHFVLPAAATVAIAATGVYLSYLAMTGDADLARTALATAMSLCGVVLIAFASPPSKAWTGGTNLTGDRRPALLAIGVLALYVTAMMVPPFRSFFELTTLPALDVLAISGIVAVWALALRFVWRTRLFERLLSQEAA